MLLTCIGPSARTMHGSLTATMQNLLGIRAGFRAFRCPSPLLFSLNSSVCRPSSTPPRPSPASRARIRLRLDVCRRSCCFREPPGYSSGQPSRGTLKPHSLLPFHDDCAPSPGNAAPFVEPAHSLRLLNRLSSSLFYPACSCALSHLVTPRSRSE
jgi:hypothetical protein